MTKPTDAEILKAKETLQNEKNLNIAQNQPGLRRVRSSYSGLTEEPPGIRMESEAGVVFYNLQIVYQTHNNVSEGIIGDTIWSFRQSGIPNAVTWRGFLDLKKLGYINFTDDTGVVLVGEPNENMWFRWTRKFYGLLLEEPAKKETLKVDEKIVGEDTTVEKLEE